MVLWETDVVEIERAPSSIPSSAHGPRHDEEGLRVASVGVMPVALPRWTESFMLVKIFIKDVVWRDEAKRGRTARPLCAKLPIPC